MIPASACSPHAASTQAGPIDALYGFLLLVSGFFTIGIALAIVWFCIKYRRGNTRLINGTRRRAFLSLDSSGSRDSAGDLAGDLRLGAGSPVFRRDHPPAMLEIDVVAKQWMWKFQHPDGRREINELHVPVGQPVKLTMISQDVIHSFYVPAFRVKQDVLPGRYTSRWFEATKPGEYHLFCAEYCGTNHSRMGGRVMVMAPADYADWLSGALRTTSRRR